MELLRANDFRRMPWKNGGGETFEIAVSPPQAELDAIDWRISMAVVAGDGPFSLFPGVDRTLTILNGAGMELELGAAQASVLLTPESDPFHFPGDIAAEAGLLAGTITDLNVMSRRNRYRHIVRRIMVRDQEFITTAADAAAVFCCAGVVDCSGEGVSHASLQERDCMLFRAPPRELAFIAAAPAMVLLAEFYRTTA
ncbi:MAG: HutD family protein [Pseudomonadota bacterium]